MVGQEGRHPKAPELGMSLKNNLYLFIYFLILQRRLFLKYSQYFKNMFINFIAKNWIRRTTPGR